MNEFDLIARYFARPVKHADLGVGDDAALMSVTPGHQLAVSADMLVAGRHFFLDANPERLGHKSLAVNLSDLAAMGAKPTWFTLSLALPVVDEAWLAGFSKGMFALADEHGIELVGGDTTRGPLTIAIQIAGEVPKGQAILRSGARAGDDIWVSGPLGAAAAAVMHRYGDIVLPAELLTACDHRLDLPTPRVALGTCLRGVASAALDISDGLIGDLKHICERSAVGAEIDLAAVPAAAGLDRLPENLRQKAILAGGDDYELCFTAPAAARATIMAMGKQLQLPLSRIGQITIGDHVRVMQQDRELVLSWGGFDHFG